MRIPINGQSYEAFSVDVNYQRTVNWYVEFDPTGANNTILYPTPGQSLFTTAGNGPIRAMAEVSGVLYAVSGNELYSVTTAGLATSLGTLQTSSGIVNMAHNGTQLIIVDGTQGYLYDTGTTTFTADIAAVDPQFPDGCDQVIFLDGYFIVNDPLNTNALGEPGAFFISGLYDGLSWAALDYTIAERKADQIKALAVSNGQLWCVGEESTEVYSNSGNPLFPYERVNSAVIEYGTIAPESVSEVSNNLIFLSRSDHGQGQVMMTTGYSLRRISNDALDAKIQGYSDITDAFSYVFQYKGHLFYVLTFPTANKTHVYDLSTNNWFEWSYNGSESRHNSNAYKFFNQKHVVGNNANGKLYYLKDDVYDDDGTAITRLRQSPHMHAQGRWMFGSVLAVQFEQGVANASFTDPQVMLQWSKDRGHTWDSEQWRSFLGQTGVYDYPSTWRRLGRWQSIMFRIKVTDGVKAVMYDAFLDADVGEDEVRK